MHRAVCRHQRTCNSVVVGGLFPATGCRFLVDLAECEDEIEVRRVCSITRDVELFRPRVVTGGLEKLANQDDRGCDLALWVHAIGKLVEAGLGHDRSRDHRSELVAHWRWRQRSRDGHELIEFGIRSGSVAIPQVQGPVVQGRCHGGPDLRIELFDSLPGIQLVRVDPVLRERCLVRKN